MLVRRAGHPAALAIILHDLLQRLLVAGHLTCASLVTLPPGCGGPPRAAALPHLARGSVLDPARPGSALNMCSSDVGQGPHACARMAGACTHACSGGGYAAQQLMRHQLQTHAEPSWAPTTTTPDTRHILKDAASHAMTNPHQVLVELLRHLKRAYWPFPWDTSVDTRHCSHGAPPPPPPPPQPPAAAPRARAREPHVAQPRAGVPP